METDLSGEATPEALPDTRLSQELAALVERLEGRDITVGELEQLVGDRGFGLLFLILALPAALPLPAAGYGTPFGILMAILGAQIAIGRTTPWLPASVRKRRIPNRLLAFSVRNGRLPLRVVELIVRPRLSFLARNRAFLAGMGVLITVLALILALPVPLTNTAPSFVIFVLAAGILEEDGLLLLGGLLLAPIAVGIAALAIYYTVTVGPEAAETIVKPMIKGWIGAGE